MPSPTRHVPRFPPEIIDEILRYKGLDEESLYNACLVNRSWLGGARKSLYHSVWLMIVGEETTQDTVYPSPALYRYELSSSQFLTTLGNNLELATLVKHIRLNSASSGWGAESDLSAISTSPEAFLLSTMRLASSAHTFRFEDDFWLDPDHFGCFARDHERLQNIVVETVYGTEWFEPISRLPKLRSLRFGSEIVGVPAPRPRTSTNTLVSNLRELSCVTCTPEQFDTLTFGSMASLRKLAIPLSLISSFRPGSFPNLVRLTIGDSKSSPDFSETAVFRTELKESTSLVLLDLCSAAVNVLNATSRLSMCLSSSCQRLNLRGTISLDSVACIVQ